MNDVLSMLQAQLGDHAVDSISRQIGADHQQTSQAVASALPVLLQAMSRNASSPSGAASLEQALTRDHDGSLLDNLDGFIGNFQQGPGAGILRHVLGSKRGGVEAMLGQMNGLDQQKSSQLLEILAPIVMGTLGRQKRQGGLNAADLMGMLRQTTARQQQAHPKSTNLVNQLLDRDGDGSYTDDLTQMGMNVLGGFFRNRRS